MGRRFIPEALKRIILGIIEAGHQMSLTLPIREAARNDTSTPTRQSVQHRMRSVSQWRHRTLIGPSPVLWPKRFRDKVKTVRSNDSDSRLLSSNALGKGSHSPNAYGSGTGLGSLTTHMSGPVTSSFTFFLYLDR